MDEIEGLFKELVEVHEVQTHEFQTVLPTAETVLVQIFEGRIFR